MMWLVYIRNKDKICGKEGEIILVYKMLVMNIDGTLLQDNGRMNRYTREAIEYALAKGIYVTLATSQNFLAAKRVAKSLKLKSYIVTHQGAFIAKEVNEPLYVNRIQEDVTSEIVTLLESFSCQIRLVHEKFSIGNKVKLPENMMARVIFQTANRFTYPEQYVDSLSERLIDRPIAPLQIEVKFFKEKDIIDAKKALKEMYDEVSCFKKDQLHLEIVPAGVSKLVGLTYICDHFGVDRHEVVAIGAGLDDLPLIQWAGLGVAMGNSSEQVQEAADWVTRSNNENGVAYMVKEHFRKQYRLEFLKNMNEIK